MGVNQDGSPVHPLYVANALRPVRWRVASRRKKFRRNAKLFAKSGVNSAYTGFTDTANRFSRENFEASERPYVSM
jgi:hypothetical protein